MLINKNLWRFLPAFLKEELHRHHHVSTSAFKQP